jgi:hypothetical protein
MPWLISLILSFLQTCSCLIAFLLLQASVEDTSHEDTQPDQGESLPTDSERTATPNQPDVPPSAPRKRPVPEPAAPRASVKAGPAVGPKRARKGLQASSSSQEVSKIITLHALTTYFFLSADLSTFTSAKHLPCRRLMLLVGKLGQCRCL